MLDNYFYEVLCGAAFGVVDLMSSAESVTVSFLFLLDNKVFLTLTQRFGSQPTPHH